MSEIPKGFCQCGCGGKAPISKETRPNRGLIKGEPTSFIKGHSRWQGGRTLKKGVVVVRLPIHPRSDNKGYVPEHFLIAEKALGKLLPLKAVIHHHTPTELIICQDQAYHLLLHQRMRAFYTCGYANWRKCQICKQYDSPEKLTIGHDVYHKDCATERARKRRQHETAKTQGV